MSVVVVTPPVPEIDRDLVDAHLKLEVGEVHDDDALIDAFVAAAVSHIDGPGGWLGCSIWQQTLELRQNVFCGPIRLPYGPIQSVASVKYVDSDGTEQTLAADQYLLTNDGSVTLAHGARWPSLRGDAEGVRVRYAAGFAAVPPAVLSALLLMVGDLYAHRETAQVGSVAGRIPMSPSVENLLAPYRTWSV